MSIIPVLIAAVIVVGIPSLYLAVRYREFRKFLAGAFFVSAGMQLYFWLAGMTVPLIGTGIVQTPAVSLARGCIHFILFLLCLYFGFFREPKSNK
ncbi:MAG TPA: hypothetical protein VGH50_07080 [Candidatus Binatia bacterium]|jgi:hypothetical protein